MSYPKLSVRQVERVFSGPKGEKTQALLPVDYQVNENDFITILGPSGCGKSHFYALLPGWISPPAARSGWMACWSMVRARIAAWYSRVTHCSPG